MFLCNQFSFDDRLQVPGGKNSNLVSNYWDTQTLAAADQRAVLDIFMASIMRILAPKLNTFGSNPVLSGDTIKLQTQHRQHQIEKRERIKYNDVVKSVWK